MRVLYVNADRGIPLAGHKGASVHVRQTIGALAAKGAHVVVAAATSKVPERFSCPVVVPQIPRCEGPRFGRAVSQALGGLRFPAGMFDVVYERYSLWSTAGLQLARRLGVPLVLEVNAPLVLESQQFRTLGNPGLARRVEREMFRGADLVLPVSSTLGRYIAGIRKSTDGITVTPNAVDTELFKPRERVDGSALAHEVIFIGSLKPWHGCGDLLAAMPRVLRAVPDARLTFVGDGPERAQLEAEVARLGLGSAVRLVGAVPHEQIPDWLADAAIGVAPYPPLENFYFSPLKVGEYLAAGLATVTTVLGDLADTVRPEESCLLVEPGRPEQLAEAIVRICREPQLRARLGNAGRQIAVRSLSLGAATTRLVQRMEHTIATGRAAIRRVS
jgi:glycosyltransferase involved in cell wall biosynthesis